MIVRSIFITAQALDETVDALLAAMSFHDAWAYMMYNATEDALPDIDGVLPPRDLMVRTLASHALDVTPQS